ncbi:hypothetical protein FIBSPDRAFT_120068 [Athelia psychrophila]|uniref:Uncharacterized protein n=1 Tax=Athelia psychrophila TaxID=1759441 RepID=A0A166CRD6_9AGAM|nr:hypothetical protein FIBSPDRAFT_120068 [Fibularhizoctonia sp. CBS 109695]
MQTLPPCKLLRPLQKLDLQPYKVRRPCSCRCAHLIYSPAPYSALQRASSPPSALSQPGTRPSSRADRRLRFADITPNDVHVYESAPSSPKRKPFALLSPLDDPDPSTTTSLGTFSASTLPPPSSSLEKHPETGTPEDIRRRFFPNAPAFDPNLAWMDPAISSGVPAGPESTDLRFDLTGTPISPAMAAELPTHLGLHHHGDPALRAGYTLDDLFLLSRSTVPAQRSVILDVLARLVHKLGKGLVPELKGREEELRKRVLAAGVEAMGERGNVGARAVEIIWECLVGWDDAADVDGVELGSSGDGHAISSLPLESFLDQIATSLAHGSLPRHSLTQLLAIIHRLAKHTNAIADSITATPNLVPAVLRTYLLTPYPPNEDQALPDPAALHLLATLARASRANALTLTDPADALLRFLTTLPPASAYTPALATALLGSTLTLYTALARYGLYAHIATIASTHFASLTAYILSTECSSQSLTHAWVELVESWITCAIDPHATTPEHEILWTQVVAWDWAGDMSELKGQLRVEGDAQTLWAGVWRAQAAWLEGARVNGERGGEEERAVAVRALQGGFEDGNDKVVLTHALDGMQAAFRSPEINADAIGDLAAHARVVSAAIRLWLSTLPNATTAPPSPPYALPFSDLSQLAATLVAHPLWNLAPSPSVQVHLRSLSGLLALYIRLSRVLPGISQDLWMAQGLSVLCRLVPGDEEIGTQLLDDIINFITREFTATRGLNAPPIVWERGGMDVIKPFMTHAVQPDSSVYIGLLNASPRSIKLATTQCVPRRRAPGSGHGLPLASDWVLTPLDHLLRSATSPVLQAMPSTWNASETEVARASLLLAKVVKEVLGRFGLGAQGMGRAETVFGCMKVFMLEHDQPQGDDGDVEVFRDAVVERLMEELLAPFAAASDSARAPVQFGLGDDLEKAAARFLGASTPFYQYYTDFVALYDSVSFSHPIFARLLLPPTSMRYAPDYRKHLWSDFGHVLRSVKTPIEQVITQDVREYLWPVETDNLILASYLQALIKGPLEGFLRLVAVHHIAHNIWPDLGGGEEIERAKKFVKAIAEQGDGPAVREVLRYRQDGRDNPLLVPPACFAQGGDWKGGRMEFIGRCIGEDMRSRLAVVFDEAL